MFKAHTQVNSVNQFRDNHHQQPKHSRKPSFILSQKISQVNSIYNSRNFDQNGIADEKVTQMFEKTATFEDGGIAQQTQYLNKIEVKAMFEDTTNKAQGILTSSSIHINIQDSKNNNQETRAASKESLRVQEVSGSRLTAVRHNSNKISIIKRKYVEGTPIKLDQSVFQQFVTKANNRQQRKPLIPQFNLKLQNSKQSQKSYIEPERSRMAQQKIVQQSISLRQSLDNKENMPILANQPKSQLHLETQAVPRIQEMLIAQLKKEKQLKCKQIRADLLNEEDKRYIQDYGVHLLKLFSESSQYQYHTSQMLKNHPSLTFDLRSKIIDWIYNATTKSRVEDKNVFFFAVKLLDQYYQYHTTPLGKDTLQLVGATTIFMAAKMLEIQFLDMEFCEQRFLHSSQTRDDVLRVESELMFYTGCDMQQFSVYDVYCHLASMLKQSIQQESNKMSKMIYTFFKEKVDSLAINELMVITSMPKYLQVSDVIKASALLNYHVQQLGERIKSKNINFLTQEYEKLCEQWDNILLQAPMNNLNYICNLGNKINSDLQQLHQTHKLKLKHLLSYNRELSNTTTQLATAENNQQ